MDSQTGLVAGRDQGTTIGPADSPQYAALGDISLGLPAICISSTDWGFLAQRPQHIMRRYSQRAPVLYVNPPKLAKHSRLFSFAFPELQRVSETLWSMSPAKAFPLDRSIPPLRFFNDQLVKRAVMSKARELDIDAHILWCYHYDSTIFRHMEATKLVVYDCVDDWSAFWKPYQDVVNREARLTVMSDIIFTTSQRLYDTKKRINPHTYMVPNGVDFELFRAATQRLNISKELKDIRRPIIGFSGAVHYWIDLQMIETIAARRPEWSFVFVGPIGANVRCPQMPNMHFLGAVPYEKLPDYVASFDVCIAPFHRSELTESVNPIKIFEYLATGRPIVFTNLPEVRRFSHVIEIADGPAAFEEAIARALRDDSSDRVKLRQSIASENSWDKRFDVMMRAIGEYLAAVGV